jgi:hypothetical protein
MSLRPTSSSTRRSQYGGQRTSSPPRTFLGTSDLIESLNKTVRDPSHLAATPSCMLQPRTQSRVEGHKTMLPTLSRPTTTTCDLTGPPRSTSGTAISVTGQIPCPRYDPVYAFRHKDGVQFPLESFSANHYFSYSGDFVESKRHGAGVVIAQDGSSIAGEFQNGEITGYGVHTWPDGTVYTGQLVKGEAHGEGDQIWASGGVAYRGAFCCGQMHGKGRWTRYVRREIYEGDFFHHKRHGHGTWTVAGEFTYTGEFADGVPHGHGTLVAGVQPTMDINAAPTRSRSPPFAASDDVGLSPPPPAALKRTTTYVGQFLHGAAHGTNALLMTTSDQGETIRYSGPMEGGRRVENPRSILPLSIYVRDSLTTATEYIQSGKAPPPPTQHGGGRGNNVLLAEMMLSDPFLPVFVGTSIRISAMQATIAVPNPMGVQVATAASPSADARRSTSAAVTSKPLSVMNLPKPGGGRNAAVAQPIKRTKHILDELCAKLRPPAAIVSGTTSGDPLQRTPNTPALGPHSGSKLPPPLSLGKTLTPPLAPLPLTPTANRLSSLEPAVPVSLRNCHESGRRLRLAMYRCSPGEDPFTCHTSSLLELGQYAEEPPEAPWCFFKEDTTAAQVAASIGDALLAAKKNPSIVGMLRPPGTGRGGPGSSLKTPSMRSPNASKPTTARTVDTRKASIAGGGPLDEIQPSPGTLPNPSPLLVTELTHVAGADSLTEFHVRLAPTVPPGDYVLIIEVLNPYIIAGPLQQQAEYHDILPLRIPVRVCAMDFQMQKNFTQLVEGNNITAAQLGATASSVASGDLDLPIPDSDDEGEEEHFEGDALGEDDDDDDSHDYEDG